MFQQMGMSVHTRAFSDWNVGKGLCQKRTLYPLYCKGKSCLGIGLVVVNCPYDGKCA